MELLDDTKGYVANSTFHWCCTAMLLQGNASGMMEDSKILHNRLGVVFHNKTRTVVRRTLFQGCIDGSLLSGFEPERQVCGHACVCRKVLNAVLWWSLSGVRLVGNCGLV